ncbi:cysteine desulfurase, putative [Theileria annulata]|uniref:cysteine desulfurase n=1 Tax=Theileria annulata TaxID=5874 RepID=Q4UFY9_THEAN|nr:cysteine desulfurase, putative [Theileria annulata]CAI74000.1 cysteine desulfurase, putative [Theileria annulata]|eukprot:XP_954680.1 cysteine desulfurase, putative [Theileria annulata]
MKFFCRNEFIKSINCFVSRYYSISIDIQGQFKTSCGKKTYNRVYLDNQATTCVDPRVLDSMMPYLTHAFGNPHSRTHSYGWEAEKAVETARADVANLINCESKNVIFTSGATESNNLAIKGSKSFYGRLVESPGKSKKNHVITTQIEHKCVLQCCRQLENEGYSVTYLKPDKYGMILPDLVRKNIRPETFLCSVIHVNNEIGVIQNISEIGRICKEHKVIFHTDAAQSFGKLPIDLKNLDVDLLSISGHKIYGPKGVGALFVRTKPRIRLQPIIDGGGQERGLRSGTLPTALVVGLGTAAKIAKMEMKRDQLHMENLFFKLYNGLSAIDHVSINGSIKPGERYFGNLNMSFEFIEGESLLMSLSNFALSSGSACTSASLEPSYVLRSLDVSEELAHTSIRFGLGRFTMESEVDMALESITKVVEKLRNLSPLYEILLEKKMYKYDPEVPLVKIHIGKWIFRCLGCNSKEQDETEYIDLSKIKNVDEVLHINDLIVSKPELYVETPKSYYVTRKLDNCESEKFGGVKPTTAIPIQNQWPSETSSENSTPNQILIKEFSSKNQKRDGKDNYTENNKIVVQLSNITGFLEKESDKQLTISESIAIAEKIYQNEKRQIMNLGKAENQDSKSTNYVESDKIKYMEFNNPFEMKEIDEKYTLSRKESPNSIITNENYKKETKRGKLSHICDVSDDSDEDEESLASRVWNMFMKVSSAGNNDDQQVRNRKQINNNMTKERFKSKIPLENEEKINRGEHIWKGNGKDKGVINEKQWIKENYKVSSGEALEIVEGTIRKINNLL